MTERLSSDERRRHLLDAVGRLINREGIARVTMVAVAAEAGVSRRLVYDFFPDLSTLLVEFAVDAMARALGRSEAWIERDRIESGEALRNMFQLFVALDADQRALMKVFSSAPVISPEINRVRELMEARVLARWRPFALLEDLSDEDVVMFAETMIGLALNLAEGVRRGAMTVDAGGQVLVDAGTATAAAFRARRG